MPPCSGVISTQFISKTRPSGSVPRRPMGRPRLPLLTAGETQPSSFARLCRLTDFHFTACPGSNFSPRNCQSTVICPPAHQPRFQIGVPRRDISNTIKGPKRLQPCHRNRVLFPLAGTRNTGALERADWGVLPAGLRRSKSSHTRGLSVGPPVACSSPAGSIGTT